MRTVTPRHSPPLVLVVDDEADLLTLTARRLRRAGLEVLGAADGESAWEVILERMPDAVVLDVRMPGLDGLTLTRRIRDHADVHDLMVVLLTASVQSAEEADATAAGADAFVRKPCTAAELLDALEPLLGGVAST